ncbi:MAG: aminotransferase class III-fold pyridoxal phosphate-dependent enzyme [Gemmataceae bacterium]|nr:aminotransferase class III-fold pyridoxal phosphate-dependent enzyme [Gemmataceae bacterium]
MNPIQHANETLSNKTRETLGKVEPRSLRAFTPSLAVLEKSAGVFHWTPEGRKLFDFSSGVLVANLGHNPRGWMERFFHYMGWDARNEGSNSSGSFFPGKPMTAYNAVTQIEIEASERLLEAMRRCPGGEKMQQVLWAASGSEAIQKALWAALARDRNRDMILATRFGFHGKKGLANAVTGSETDRDRDPRVRFISFPMAECVDVSTRDKPFDPSPYQKELDTLWNQFGRKICALITEPYLGGGGSYHPPKEYHQLLQRFCQEKEIVFILDEVQSNFGRTNSLFAYETYGIEPDIVVLGKGLGNGVPVAAAVGGADFFSSLEYGEGSDTWSANPICCAAVLATLDDYADGQVIARKSQVSQVIEAGLLQLKKDLPFICHVRGEKGGMVWGVETRDWAGITAADWANKVVEICYRGDNGNEGIHLLGPLAKKVIRISPPLIITHEEAQEAMRLMHRLVKPLGKEEKARSQMAAPVS